MPSLTLVNLETGEAKESPLVPEELAERIKVQNARMRPFGASHAVLQYTGTDNRELPDVVLRGTAETVAELEEITDFLNFMQSLCYPPQGRSTIREGAPPRVLFVWPGSVTLICRVEAVEVRREQFNSAGQTIRYTASLSLVETSEDRIVSEQVRRLGSQRATGGGAG
jgi:hypothetical protein